MKVALVYPYFNNRGGIERYLWEIARILSYEHEITIVTSLWDKDCEKKYTFFKVPILSTPYFLSSFTFSMFSYLKLKKYNFDIVHTQGASCFKQDVITAHSCHKAWFIQSLEETRKWTKNWWLKLFNPLHYLTIFIESIQYHRGNCKKVIAISNIVKSELIRFYKIPEENIEVIYNGVNCEEFHPDNRELYFHEIRNRHNIKDKEIILLFIANEFKRKGLEYLLKAVSLLGDEYLKLLVIGKDKAGKYINLSKDLGIADKVIFVGQSQEIKKYYAASDIFVFPTSYEPFGLTVAEAMASGIPVIVSKTAGVAELIQDNRDGLLLNNYKDPEEIARLILQLLSDPEKRLKTGIMARKKIEKFTWERIGDKISKLYLGIS
jgi:UDP-glucose:(heptosyl)LPS alpha-1,3-glucosyltransferase